MAFKVGHVLQDPVELNGAFPSLQLKDMEWEPSSLPTLPPA